MNASVAEVKSLAVSLSSDDRAELIYFLLDSLDSEAEGAEEAWRSEIGRRVAEIRSGKAVGRPAEAVLAELRERYR